MYDKLNSLTRVNYLTLELIETNEILDLLNNIISLSSSALDSITSAKNWGIYDILGGGILSSLFKHDKINNTKSIIDNLNIKLESLKEKLHGVNLVYESKNLDLCTSNHTFDVLFDNIFTDLYVQDKINNTYLDIKVLIDNLNVLRSEINAKKLCLEDLIDETNKNI